MIKTIKRKRKLLDLLDNEDEKNLVRIEIYTILLGYFSRKKDINIYFDENELLSNIEHKIRNLLKTNYRILGIKDNSLDSFNIFINNYCNESNKKICDKLSNNFNFAYSYYDYFHNKYNSIFDYIITHKHTNMENKIKKLVLD